MRLQATRASVTSGGGAIDALYRAAGSKPTLDQRFAKDKSLVDKISGNNLITFSRASTGTYVDSDGLIKTAVADAPRFDHDPVTGESLGLLIEESRTNLAKYSEPDDRSTNNVSGEWTFGNLDPNTEITKVEGPDGVSNSASEMQLATGSGSDADLHAVPVTSGAPYTFSAWVKLGTATNFALHVNNASSWNSVPDGTYSFDVNDGLNTNTFVKVSHTFTAPSTGIVNAHIGRHPGTAPAQQTQGTVTVWGCQVELGAFSSSTIISSGSTVTRSPDIASIEGTNFSSWYNQSEGTVFVDFMSLPENTLLNQVVSFNDGSNSNRINVTNRSNGTYQAEISASNVPQLRGDYPFDSERKVSLAYKTNDANYSYSGQIGVLDTSVTLPVVDEVDIGYLNDYLNGHISRLAYFTTRKTDQELIKITDGTLDPAIITYGITSAGGTFNLRSTSTVDYAVDWDSTGGYEASTSNTLAHTYTAGNYDLVVYSDGVYRPFFVNATADAAQITSVAIGSGADLGTNLTYAWFGAINMTTFACPFDVTSSVTDFSSAWQSCTSLVSFPELNTSSGTNFYHAWYNCSSLTSFPELNTSSGTNFNETWRDCSSLTSFPSLNTSSGTNFSYTWYNCTSLTSFPLLDTSSGTTFNEAWHTCSSLTSFPLLDTSSGTSFYRTWYYCTSLTSFPLLDASSVTSFSRAWQNCTSLTSFPLLDASSVTSFFYAWYGCTSLTSFPELNTSSGTNFSQTWLNCNSLTSFPLLNTSSGTNFGSAWYNCLNLTSFPLLNTSSGTDFSYAWQNCSSLTSFPANMFDTTGTLVATAFTNAWTSCALTAQSIENILVSLDTNGATGITLGINGGTNAAKTTWSAAAVTAYDNLIANGWSINFNA